MPRARQVYSGSMSLYQQLLFYKYRRQGTPLPLFRKFVDLIWGGKSVILRSLVDYWHEHQKKRARKTIKRSCHPLVCSTSSWITGHRRGQTRKLERVLESHVFAKSGGTMLCLWTRSIRASQHNYFVYYVLFRSNSYSNHREKITVLREVYRYKVNFINRYKIYTTV